MFSSLSLRLPFLKRPTLFPPQLLKTTPKNSPSCFLLFQRKMCHPQPETSRSSDMKPAFQVLDTDCDGRISLNDLRNFYSGYCGANEATEEDMGSMISVADSNKDGFVEFDEFERMLDGCTRPAGGGGGGGSGRFGLMEEVFRVMDRDGDGKLGFHDLKSHMGWAGFSASDDDIWAMIRMGGGDDQEGVGFDGLIKILAVDLPCA